MNRPKGGAWAATPAVVAAGEGRSSRAVRGESKVYLELGGRPLVARVVTVLQRVPEVSEVWVVGNAERLEAVFAREEIRREITKPLHIVPQFRNLYENVWQTYCRVLSDSDDPGCDAQFEHEHTESGNELLPVLFTSGDLPFATPQEISQFIQRGLELDCDYAFGLVTEKSMEAFYPAVPGDPGIRMAYFNLLEGRFRTSNLHLVKPTRIANRRYIDEMYEHRYQKEFHNIIALAWRLLRKEAGSFRILRFYLLIHLAGWAHRRGWKRVADRIRVWIPLERVAATLSSLFRADVQFVTTDVGGCGLDIDNAHDFDTAKQAFEAWATAQNQLAVRLYGELPAPQQTGSKASL